MLPSLLLLSTGFLISFSSVKVRFIHLISVRMSHSVLDISCLSIPCYSIENGEQLLQKAFSLAVEGGFNVLPNLKETLMLLQLHSGTAP